MEQTYTLHFDFTCENGTDFFENVSNFIICINGLNKALCSYINQDIYTEIILQDLQNGSLKVIIKDSLKGINNQMLKEYIKNPKEAIADFLIIAKDKLIGLLENNPKELPNKADKAVCEVLAQSELKNYGYKNNKTALLKAVSDLSQSTKGFCMPPSINLKGKERLITPNYEFDTDDLDDVIRQKSELKGSFIIKKPDLAGASKWTIISDKAIEVKIIDEQWLQKLKNHEIALGYGDKIDGTLISDVLIDKDLNVLSVEYRMDNITGIQTPMAKTQKELL